MRLENEYRGDLTSISATFNYESESVNLFFKTLTAFKGLTSLDLVLVVNSGFAQFVSNGLEEVLNSCSQLKRLKIVIKFTGNDEIPEEFRNLFKIVNKFNNITVFHYTLVIDNPVFASDYKTYGVISDLSDLKKLKEFKFNNRFINDDYFENIGQYLPQLKSLWIQTYRELSDKTLQCLSHLKSLNDLKILCQDSDPLIRKLLVWRQREKNVNTFPTHL